MSTEVSAKRLVLNMLEEQALALGGCVAIGGISDEAVPRLVHALESAGRRALRRLEREGPGRADPPPAFLRPHPEIEGYLGRLRRAGHHGRSQTVEDA